MLRKNQLEQLYVNDGASMAEIAKRLGVSVRKVQYWMDRYGLRRRSISEAIYQKCNPSGDPFSFVYPKTIEEAKLFGLGIGLYWGEGTKANKGSVRLGNTDPELIKIFIAFLVKFFKIDKADLRFSLQVFQDQDPIIVERLWQKVLRVERRQFTKTTVTPSVARGTYRKKSERGVLTLYYHNTKLRNLLVSLLPG